MSNARKFFLDLIYPNRCPCCGEFIAFDELICGRCAQALRVFDDGELCSRCGRESCICASKKPAYSRCFCFCAYEDAGREGVLALKSGKNTNFAEYLGERLADMLSYADILHADCIAPAPLTRRNRIERGYNQSELIARAMAKRLGAEVIDVFRCEKSSLVQHELNAAMRAENAMKITASGKRLDGKTVIFCDDIITTGSTARRCCALLRELGAAEVYAAVGTSARLSQ